MANTLNLAIYPDITQINGVNNCTTNIEGRCQLSIKSRCGSFSSITNCLVISEITGPLPQVKIPSATINSWKIPENISLADPAFDAPGTIDLLIGASLFWDIMLPTKISLGKNSPILQKTQLGWILAGPLIYTHLTKHNDTCLLSKNTSNKNLEIQQQLAKFWELEECSSEKILSEEEQFCETHFRENFKRNSEGRFIVSIPYKESLQLIEKSKYNAEKRFYNLERKLSSQPLLRFEYIKFMNEYKALNHMSKTSSDNIHASQYFMPHHGVINQSSKTTKLRVVFDASCATSSGYSLNQLKCVGPVIQNDLFAIILRFRQYRVAISADITKMYRQILVQLQDRAFQKILWRENASLPLEAYELNTITYGTAAASLLAIRCLHQLAIESVSQLPNASATIINDFYVDDLLSGADSVDEAISLAHEISRILESGCFPLRKWLSNSNTFLESIKKTDVNTILNLGVNENAKTLGLHWDSSNDNLLFQINFPASSVVTKRIILSTISQVFDPLGLLGACLIKAKLILQKLWLERKDWDDPVSKVCKEQWLDFREGLLQLNNVKIPRYVLSKCRYFELHGFADASEKAYGACVYILSRQSTESQCNLLCRKGKVAPLKTVTIPRLELCAALLLAQLISKVINSSRISFKEIFLWTDSSITLSWLNTSPHLLKLFVSTRVRKVQELTKGYVSKHVPSADNPADLLSRGMNAEEFLNSKLWWMGPH